MIRRAALTTLGLALVVTAGLAAPAQAAKKPDLFVTNARVHGDELYAFQGQTADTSFTFQTRNRGEGRANRSVTEVALRHGATDYRVGQAGVRQLDGVGGGLTATAARVPDVDDDPLRFTQPLGAYTMRVCADARDQIDEAVETNNCRTIQTPGSEPERFFVVRKVWKGQLHGFAVSGDVTEKFHSGDDVVPFAARLVFERQTNADGLFLYDFAGPVTYEDSSSGSSGCTWSGGDTQTFGPRGANADSSINFDYLNQRYAGQVAVNGSFYTVHMTCGSTTLNQPGPFVQQAFLNVGPPQSFPFGATRLQDGYSTQSTSWVWNFR